MKPPTLPAEPIDGYEIRVWRVTDPGVGWLDAWDAGDDSLDRVTASSDAIRIVYDASRDEWNAYVETSPPNLARFWHGTTWARVSQVLSSFPWRECFETREAACVVAVALLTKHAAELRAKLAEVEGRIAALS